MSVPREPDRAQVMLSVPCAQWGTIWPGLKSELEDGLGRVDFETVKLFTKSLEKGYCRPDGKRLANLDPRITGEANYSNI